MVKYLNILKYDFYTYVHINVRKFELYQGKLQELQGILEKITSLIEKTKEIICNPNLKKFRICKFFTGKRAWVPSFLRGYISNKTKKNYVKRIKIKSITAGIRFLILALLETYVSRGNTARNPKTNTASIALTGMF